MDYHGGRGTDGDVGGSGGSGVSGGHFLWWLLRWKNVPEHLVAKVQETTSNWPQQTRGYWQDF